MKLLGVFALSFLAASAASVSASTKAARSAGTYRSDGQTGPVEKVVNLLKDLKDRIEQDGKVEQQTYDKYACFCEKATDAKATAIEKAQDDLRALGQDVLKYKGEVAVYEAELAQLKKEIDTNKEEQAEATAIRQKENAAYAAETAEMKEALAALQKAITVLRKATTFAQMSGGNSATAVVDAASQGVRAVEEFVQALPSNVIMKPAQTELLSEFMYSKDRARYAPQSFTVQGILTDMYATFSSDIEASTQDEAIANTVFENLIATKMAELQNLENTRAKKTADKAAAEENLADTTQSYDDTEAQMSADVKFFDETKASCAAKASEWKVRSDLRAEELRGISDALAILTTDDARELFKTSIKAGKETGMADGYDTGVDIAASFLQVGQSAAIPALQDAYTALKGGATQAHSVRLAMLAAQVHEAKVGHFDKVIVAIDEMMKALRDEDVADIAKRDQCTEEYKNIASTIANVTWLIEKNDAKIDKLQGTIEKRDAERLQTIEDIQNIETQMTDMTTVRTAGNAEFKQAKANDQAAIELLVQARSFLSSYYSNNSIELGPIQGNVKGLALISARQPDFQVDEFQAPDSVFSGQGKRKNEAKGIVQLLTTIIEDLNDEIKNGMRDEEATQLEYEKLFKAATDLRAKLETKKLNLEEVIAHHREEKSDEEQTKEANHVDLKDEKDYKASIKIDCDWILNAFEGRSTKRQAELAGLTKAKEFLAGYDKAAMIETGAQQTLRPGANFDDAAFSKLRFLGLSH